jgi:cell division protein ZapA (FtsZ GTPase activity inhibitor)
MAESETKKITVVIAGRPYPLKIQPGDEASLRKIIKEINDKVNQFQLTYTKKDKQDCLSMALLTYAVDLHKFKKREQRQSAPSISRKVEKVNELLDQILSEQ